MKLLALGPLPPPLGGTTVLFDDFRTRVAELPIKLTVIDMNDRRRGTIAGRLYAVLGGWVRLFRALSDSDVISLHASSRRFVWYGAALYIISQISGRPVILRAFGGSLDLLYQRSGLLTHTLFRLAFANSLILLETRHLAGFFRAHFPKARIDRLPNCRSAEIVREGNILRNGRFIFVGHVNEAKGITTLIKMLRTHPNSGIEIDVIGPLTQKFQEEVLRSVPGLNYLGVISPEEVTRYLGRYEALVLPTHYEGEGYPGVILEAYAQGTPVVSTHWRSIPEIVINERTGLLVEPNNPEQLHEALIRLRNDSALWRRMQRNAARYARCFDSHYWHMRKWQIWLDSIYKRGLSE